MLNFCQTYNYVSTFNVIKLINKTVNNFKNWIAHLLSKLMWLEMVYHVKWNTKIDSLILNTVEYVEIEHEYVKCFWKQWN